MNTMNVYEYDEFDMNMMNTINVYEYDDSL